MELREAVTAARDGGGERRDEAVVDGDPEDDTEGVKERERSRRDFERGNVSVHGFTLEDEVVAHLAVYGGENYAGRPYREEADDGF